MFDFGTITNWLDALLNSVMPGWLATCHYRAGFGSAVFVDFYLVHRRGNRGTGPRCYRARRALVL